MTRTRWMATAALLLAPLAACDKGGTTGGTGTTTGATSAPAPQDTALVHQNAVLQAQKDSLFGATRSLLAAMASIDSAVTLAGEKPRHKGEPITTSYESDVRQRTLAALEKLRGARSRLRTVSAAVAGLKSGNSAMKAQIDTLQSTIASMQTQLTTQQTRADSLVRELGMAKARGDSLEYRTKQLGYTIDSMTYQHQHVWFVAATKDQLIKRGVAEQAGGSRFPLIVRVGATIRPAPRPDTTQMHAIDMMQTQVIPVDTTRSYEVISGQDLTATDRSNAKGRVYHGPIRITDPERFWRGSPYLILQIL